MDNRIVPGTPLFRGYPPIQRPYIPQGLNALYNACRLIYPDQPNPLQVTALVKFWLNGPDPLDYISMYANAGDPSKGIDQHWHYISFGLSDLHGDGRVHDITTAETPSGFGFELTFRLKRIPEDTMPPTWPAAIMQALAKYVFQSENTLCAGDHVSWHCPLDNSESRIQHMLMCEDPQLGTVHTPNGPVTFVQIVGVCNEELQAAQGWNGPGVIDLMKRIQGAGGPWLITDMSRGETIFELNHEAQAAVDDGIAADGSNLSGVSARCTWIERKMLKEDDQAELERGFSQMSVSESEEIKATLKKGLKVTFEESLNDCHNSSAFECSSPQNGNQFSEMFESNMNEAMPIIGPAELGQTKYFEGVHVRFNLEAGTILPLALRGRLKHGRHFTFKNAVGNVAVTFVPITVTGSLANLEHPYAAYGPWLQILLNDEDIECMLTELTEASQSEAIALPKTFEWCNRKLLVTFMHEDF